MASVNKTNQITCGTGLYQAPSSFSIYVYSLSQAIGGIVVLFIFFSLLFSPAVLQPGLPLIVGFNSAAAGFAILNRKKATISSLKLHLAGVAVFLGVSGTALLSLFCPWVSFLDMTNLFSALFSALMLVFIGAWIGTRSQSSGISINPTTQEEEHWIS